jgi:hypothetical protein
MSTATIQTPPRSQGRPGTGRGLRPQSRPPGLSGPFPASGRSREVRACPAQVAFPAPMGLTERGIAVILMAAALLLISAVVVIGLTAARVSGPNYVTYGQTSVLEQ